jgi:competence protein ComEC
MTLFYLCISWLAGIALAPVVGLPLAASLVSGALFFLFAFTVRKIRIAFLCLSFFLFGSARLSAAQPAPGPSFVGFYVGSSAEWEIELEEDPVARTNGLRARARIVRIRLDDGTDVRDLEGMVLVELPADSEDRSVRYGDRLVLYGSLQPPPEIEGFNYADYLARQGVYGIIKDPAIRSVSVGNGNPVRKVLYSFRRRGLSTIRELFPEPEGSLLAGILLGEESSIPAVLKEDFSKTGTTHIVAISGFNISIIAGLFLAFTKRLPRRIPGWLLAAAGIALYTVLVGAAPSVVRSAIMGGMAILARQLGRRSHGLTSLAFAGAAMAAADPWTVWDIGFQLSFAATLGLILYADPLQSGTESLLQRMIPRERARSLASVASEVLLMTLAAQITTLPVILFHFNSLSLSALLVNPLVLSVQPMVMIAGGSALLAGMAWLPAGRALAWAGWAPTAYTIRVVEWGAGFAGLFLPTGSIHPVWIAGYYLALFGGTVLKARNMLPHWEWGKQASERIAAAALPFLAAGAFLAWGAYFHRPDGRLHLTMLPTGGEALILRTPSGGAVLIDGGGDPNLVIAGLGRILGFGRQRLDWIVVGSAAAESAAGLAEVAARFDIGGVLLPAGADRNGRMLAPFLARCGEHNVPVYEAGDGYRLDLGAGAGLRVVALGKTGMILAVEYGAARWLILDGLDDEINRRMLSQGRVPQAQVALFPLAIKKTADLSDWLGAIRPAAGLWPFAQDLGWPEGTDLLRTDVHGWIELATDGVGLWVRTEK